jgi:hypothetical protein
LTSAEDTSGSAAEGVYHEVTLVRIEQHDGCRPDLGGMHLCENAESFERTILQFRADHRDVRLKVL